MKSIRIYGMTRDFGSYAQVTRGFYDAFKELCYSPDLLSLEEEPTFDDEPSGLPTADIAIFTGPPIMAARMTRGTRHKRRFVMIAPNSDKLPERTMQVVNQHATELLSPSAWGAEVVRRYTDKPVHVVPHGIDRMFRLPSPARAFDGKPYQFKILHLSSSDGERKGTLPLVHAFLDAQAAGHLPQNAELTLVLTPAGKGQILDSGLRLGQNVRLMDRVMGIGASPTAMAQIYGMHHLVCQPSRGEGFGMVPLEALACGVPVVATRVTGHTEWFIKEFFGTKEVHAGELAPIDDMPGALAPSVSADQIRMALLRAYDVWPALWEEAQLQAAQIDKTWRWRHQLLAFRKYIEESE